MTERKIRARDILRKAFPGIPPREAEEMVAIADVQSHGPGVVLCKEDAIEDAFYIILDGEVAVTKVINDTQDRLLKILVPGDFFGEMGLIHNAPRAATVTTRKPTQVMSIHKKEFENMLQISSSVSLAMVKEVSRRLRENDEMAIEDLRLKAGELANAYQRLAQEDFARREFLTSIAQELKNPLKEAIGFLDTARDNRVDEETLQIALNAVSRNLQQIISLVNDISFLQEVELVLPEMHHQDLGEVVISAAEQVKQPAKLNRIRMEMDIAPSLPDIQGHFNSLVKAVTMVLDNAIKFSPMGSDVFVSVDSDGERVWVRVTDHGIGIPPDAIPHIFDRFFLIGEVGETVFDGLGLGLAITRQVIEQHQGDIQVESEEGKGSTFTIYLDAMKEPPQEYGM